MMIDSFEHFFISLYELVKWAARQMYYGFPRTTIHVDEHNETVAVLGNGDSLRNLVSKDNWNDIDYCSVNFSPLSDFFFKVKPKYHVLADNSFFITPDNLKERVDSLVDNLGKVDWKLFLFVPVVYKKYALDRYGNNPNINIQFFSRNSFTHFFCFKKLEYSMYKRGIASPSMVNVGVSAIYCLIHSGYKKVFLYGMEHSWLKLLYVDINNNVCMRDTHYYDNQEVKSVVLMKDGRPQRLFEQLSTLSSAFASYWDLEGFADYLGNVEIINKTKDSFIDSFKKEI